MSWTTDIQAHYERNWGSAGVPCAFSAGPIEQLPPDFTVRCFPPRSGREMWTYATCGMSQPGDRTCLELHMFSSVESNAIVELLVAVAHYHRTGAPLNLWHTVNFGRPWLDRSACEFGFISLPYLDGPDLENGAARGSAVKFYWLIPVTKTEVEFKKANGVEKLEQAFERAGFNYLDPARPGVV